MEQIELVSGFFNNKTNICWDFQSETVCVARFVTALGDVVAHELALVLLYVAEVLSPSLTAVELYTLLNSAEEKQPLVIDARSKREFEESHIKYTSMDLMNIPEEILTPG